MDTQYSEHPLFLHQQQQLQMSRQPPQAAATQINLLHHRMLLQQQQHRQQQQQLLKAMPQKQSQIPQQFQQKSIIPVYVSGMCTRRLKDYIHHQHHRPEDNDIGFWREFVVEYFAPNAKKKLCFSMYESGKHTTSVFLNDGWHCETCNHTPGHGFEASVEVLPRLFKVKYEGGVLEEKLYVDMPREYRSPSGHIVLYHAKAKKESIFEKFRVVHDGSLRIVFSSDLKICSWEFCARRHEVFINRRYLMDKANQLGVVVQKYMALAQSEAANISAAELQNYCNRLVASSHQLAKTLEVPLIDDYLGHVKSYVRCLQISQVANSMKDLIDCSIGKGIRPMESLAKFSRRTSGSSGLDGQVQQHEDQLQQQQQQQQRGAHNSNGDQNIEQAAAMKFASANGMVSVNCVNSASASTSTSTVQIQNSVNNAGSPIFGVQFCSEPMPNFLQ